MNSRQQFFRRRSRVPFTTSITQIHTMTRLSPFIRTRRTPVFRSIPRTITRTMPTTCSLIPEPTQVPIPRPSISERVPDPDLRPKYAHPVHIPLPHRTRPPDHALHHSNDGLKGSMIRTSIALIHSQKDGGKEGSHFFCFFFSASSSFSFSMTATYLLRSSSDRVSSP